MNDLDDIVVNKEELATLLQCSVPTLNELLKRYVDFPIISRGRQGKDWKFNAATAIEFVRQQRDREQRTAADRAALFAQLQLPLLETEIDRTGLSASERLSLVRAAKLELDLAAAAGRLVVAEEWSAALAKALTVLGRQLDALPGMMSRAHGLPEEVQRAMAASLAEFRRTLVHDVREQLQPGAHDAADS